MVDDDDVYCVSIIDVIFVVFLSSLKKNRKATFDVLFWGVLYSAFFVSMMEWGSRI